MSIHLQRILETYPPSNGRVGSQIVVRRLALDLGPRESESWRITLEQLENGGSPRVIAAADGDTFEAAAEALHDELMERATAYYAGLRIQR